jgi:uncharacterized membrane protein YdbT with pleckstrin-like domain
MHCPTCGVEAVQEGVYCHKCGQRLASADDAPPRQPRPAEQPASAPADVLGQAISARREAPDQLEEQLWSGGYCPKAMIGAWVLSGLASLAVLAAGIRWAPNAAWWLIVVVVMILPWLYNFAALCYRRLSVRYLLTTQRFVHERGLLQRVNNRVELLDIDDITFEQGLLERLVGVGTIRITSHDRSDPELVLPAIESVQDVTALLDNARLAERRRRGLHVEQI